MKQGFKACVCAVVLCAELFAAGALSAYAAQEQPLPDSGMTLDTAELTLDITEGDPAPVAYLNVQAPNDYFFLIWTSSDPAVASVDGTGKVTGHAEGTAAVTARNERGEKTTNVRSYLPCFDETDSCYSISEDVPLALCYDPRQVITLAGKRYLSGAVIFVRYDTDGNFVALTTSDLYLIQCYLGENSVPLMAGREKMVCICID